MPHSSTTTSQPDLSRPVLVWLRRDLRLTDNPALAAAAQTGRPVIPIFLRDDLFEALGAAPKWRFGLGLEYFQNSLQRIGSGLILRSGPALETLQQLVQETDAAALYWNRSFEPEGIARDTAIKSHFTAQGLDVKSFAGNLLAEPWTLTTKAGGHFRVYSPFWRALAAQEVDPAMPAPNTLPAPDSWPLSEALADWQLGRAMQRGATVVAPHLQLGEAAAQAQLDRFLAGALQDYAEGRDFPARQVTSGLSEPLAYGEISARQIWHVTRVTVAGQAAKARAAEKFLKELAWRDFAWHLSYHDPHIQTRAWRHEWEAFPWDTAADHPHFQAWQQGRTGVDLIDAGLRELYVTGKMHNRVRMIAASYLTKHLRLHWRLGQQWFADTLVDWDPASNAMGWQWVAGCGPDAAPYFRVFNPETQQKKFDAQARYTRRWLAVDSGFAEAAPRKWNVAETPRPLTPIVGLAEGRAAALAALERFKSRDLGTVD